MYVPQSLRKRCLTYAITLASRCKMRHQALWLKWDVAMHHESKVGEPVHSFMSYENWIQSRGMYLVNDRSSIPNFHRGIACR